MFLYICRELKTLRTMPKYIIITCLMLFGLAPKAEAQMGFSHEVGAIVGPVALQSDFGERHNMETNLGNTGFGIGIIHYLNFAYQAECNCYAPENYFNDHFKLRSELSYNKTKLDHFGQWADKDNQLGYQLRGMKGESSIVNIGMQLEYFPWSIRQFSATEGSLGPFISLGAQFSFYNPEVYSEYGPMGIPETTPFKYFDAYTNENGTVWSVVGSIGTRYKLTILSDLMIDLRWQYYFSDWVDGLKPDPDVYKENKANDWNVWLNVGYIYYIN